MNPNKILSYTVKSNNSFHLRKQEPLLANDGQFEFIQSLSNDQLVAYRMYNEQQSILVFINPTEHEQTFTFPFETKNIIITNLLTNHMEHPDDHATYQIAPYHYQMYKNNK